MKLEKVKIESIVADENIRSKITEASIEGLVSSIKENGLLQPILVRMKDGKYDLVAGFRRLAAIKLAGIAEVSCIIEEITDEDRTQVQLVENIQREELNPIDEAKALQGLLLKHTIDDLAMMVGKTKLFIQQRQHLLDLPIIIQTALRDKKISAGHGIVIARLNNKNARIEFFEDIIVERLSIASAERQLDKYSSRLEYAVFDKAQCKTCMHNGTNQKDLFDPDVALKGNCLNTECFKDKVKAHIDARKKLLKEKKISIISRDDTYGNEKGKNEMHSISTYDIETIGKEALRKEISEAKNVAVVFNNETGAEQLYLNKSTFRTLTKRKNAAEKVGKGSSNDPEEAARKERQAHKKISRVDETKRRFLISQLVKKATKEQLNRIVLEMLFGTERSQSETISAFLIKQDIAKNKKPNYEVRHNLFNTLSECEDDDVKLEISRIARDNIESHDTDEIILMAEEIKINMNQFVIDEEYLSKFTKAELMSLSKDFKLKAPLKFEAEGKPEMIAWILKQGIKDVPKELTK